MSVPGLVVDVGIAHDLFVQLGLNLGILRERVKQVVGGRAKVTTYVHDMAEATPFARKIALPAPNVLKLFCLFSSFAVFPPITPLLMFNTFCSRSELNKLFFRRAQPIFFFFFSFSFFSSPSKYIKAPVTPSAACAAVCFFLPLSFPCKPEPGFCAIIKERAPGMSLF